MIELVNLGFPRFIAILPRFAPVFLIVLLPAFIFASSFRGIYHTRSSPPYSIMTPAQITLVKKSWRLLRAINPAVVADAFYAKLFFDQPDLRRIFPTDMEAQYQKLMDMLTAMVVRLDHIADYQQEIKTLARRHEGYGPTPQHYIMVGEALLWTLERGLGDDWDEETAAAWAACYGMIAGAMMEPADPK